MQIKSRSTGVLLLFPALFFVLSCDGKSSHELEVPASTVWTSTDITVPDNSVVLIEAVGAISPNGETYVDANGSTRQDWNEKYNVYPGINHCALIAKVGASGEIQAIGVSKRLDVLKGGILILGFNDSDPENNEGSLDVSVHLSKMFE